MRRARVSMCMIVKNEEANLADCLASVAHVFDEIIVVDTGSTDSTREIARAAGAKVFEFAWVDDFAAARNESIRHATCEWIFWLDGDERVDPGNLQRLCHLLNEINDDLPNAYMMCQRSAPDQLTGATLVVDQARLFRKLGPVCWRYRCHEQILLALTELGAQIVRTDIVIRHLGYQAPDLRRLKRERNLRLLRLDLEENPHEAFVLFNMANAYMEEGRVSESLGFFERCLANAPPGASYLPKAYRQLAEGCHGLGRDDESLEYCREGKKQFPLSPGLWFHEGVVLLARGDCVGARHAFETILGLAPQANYAGMDENLPGCRTRHHLAFIYRRLGLFDKAEEQWRLAVAQTPEFEPPWLALAELYLDQNRQLEAEGLLLRLEGKAYRDAIWPALEARLILARGDIAGALRILEDKLARTPQALWLRVLLADILLRVAGDDIRAEHHLRAILAFSPNEPQTRQKLAQVLRTRMQARLHLQGNFR